MECTLHNRWAAGAERKSAYDERIGNIHSGNEIARSQRFTHNQKTALSCKPTSNALPDGNIHQAGDSVSFISLQRRNPDHLPRS
jgi:hypothetical protein